MLTEGAKMPKLTVLDDAGEPVEMTDLLGRPIVLWFYPKDDTPG